jgi:hypothetical protein
LNNGALEKQFQQNLQVIKDDDCGDFFLKHFHELDMGWF